MNLVQPMAPAFTTRRGVLSFCFVVIALLIVPTILRRFDLPGHEDRFPTVPIAGGPFSHLQQQIFGETSDIDVAFFGDSLMLMGIDTPYVQKELSAVLGRPARALTLSWLGRGDDLMFYVLRDLLAHRKVKLVILRLPAPVGTGLGDGPHPHAYRWLTACSHDPVQPNLPAFERVATYAIESIGGLRNLLSLVRPNLWARSPYAESLGAQLWEVGPGHGPFKQIHPTVPHLGGSGVLSNLVSPSLLTPDQRARSAYSRGYLSAIRNLLESKHVALALLRAPTVPEAREPSMAIDGAWAEVFAPAAPVVAAPPSILYSQLSDDDVRQLYIDTGHFNRNGAEYFTRAVVMPALEELMANVEEAR